MPPSKMIPSKTPLPTIARSLSFAGATPAPARAPSPSCPPISSSSSSPIQVVLRIRPLSEKEKLSNPRTAIDWHSGSQRVSITPKDPARHPVAVRKAGVACFEFSHIFGEQATQSQVFEGAVLGLVEGLFGGRSAVVLAYGVTGSGKTWTIGGEGGVLGRSLDVIVGSIRRSKGEEIESLGEERDGNWVEVDGAVEYGVFGSYLEIYNEQCFDLFETTQVVEGENEGRRRGDGRRRLKLKEDQWKEVYAEGLTEVAIKTPADVERLLEFGQRNRRVAHTLANEVSSRSHALFFISLKMSGVDQNGKPWKTNSRLSIVDLAGSERSSKVSGNQTRVKECNKINSSLMNLGRCLVAMRNNQKAGDGKSKKQVVPFRCSKLTRLLQHCLQSGSAVLIANASPAEADADATIQALRCAALAKEINLPPSKSRVLKDRTNSMFEEGAKKVGVGKKKVGQTPRRKPPVRGVRTRMQAIKEQNGAEEGKWKKEAGLLRMELEEERCARQESEKQKEEAFAECDELFRQNEKLKDRLADSEARVCVVEVEVREEIMAGVDEMFKQYQANWHRRMDALQAENDRLCAKYSVAGDDVPRLSVGAEEEDSKIAAQLRRRASRVARRASKAAFDGMKISLRDEDTEMEEDEYDKQDRSEEDWGSDEEEYIEEESEDEDTCLQKVVD